MSCVEKSSEDAAQQPRQVSLVSFFGRFLALPLVLLDKTRVCGALGTCSVESTAVTYQPACLAPPGELASAAVSCFFSGLSPYLPLLFSTLPTLSQGVFSASACSRRFFSSARVKASCPLSVVGSWACSRLSCPRMAASACCC